MSNAPARPSLGFGEALEELDAADFKPKPKATKPEPQAARKAAEDAGFRSREASKAETPRVQQRRRRTGRNAQFNIKTKPETIELFTRIADANGWGLGETFERATAMLEKEYGTR